MNRIFSPNFWISLFFSTFFTMLAIYIIKKVSSKYNIPIVSTVAEGV